MSSTDSAEGSIEIDNLLNQVEEEHDESSEEAPKKKRKQKSDSSKRPKKKQKKQQVEEEVEMVDEEEDVEDKKRRKELRHLMLKNPNLQTGAILKLTSDIENLSKEEVIAQLESTQLELSLKTPLANAENLVGLAALAIQKFKPSSKNLLARMLNDPQLLSAVDQLTPKLSDYLNGYLQVFVRIAGHVSDDHFGTQEYCAGVTPSTPSIIPINTKTV